MGLVELGALNGVLLGSLFELALRSIYIFEHSRGQTLSDPGVHIQMASYPFAWWQLPFRSLVLVTLASLVARRYLARRATSSVFLWQVIGLLAVFGLCAYGVILGWYGWYVIGDSLPPTEYLAHVLMTEMSIILRVIPFVLGFNLLFAFALRPVKVQLQ
jgi:hypothetical protein